MKLSSDDLLKLQKYEAKRGIVYAKTKGKLYNSLLLIGFLAWLYMMFMVMLYVIGSFMLANENKNLWDNTFITAFTAFIVTLISPILFTIGFKLAAFITNIITVPVLASVFIRLTEVGGNSYSSDVSEVDFGLLGLKKLFYWRHGIPMIIVMVTFIWLAVIIIRERTIIKRELAKIANNEYEPQIIE